MAITQHIGQAVAWLSITGDNVSPRIQSGIEMFSAEREKGNQV